MELRFFKRGAKKKIIFLIRNTCFTKKRIKELFKKVGKLPASHRYNRLPLLLSNPGGIQQELVVQDLPGTKVVLLTELTKFCTAIFHYKSLLCLISDTYSKKNRIKFIRFWVSSSHYYGRQESPNLQKFNYQKFHSSPSSFNSRLSTHT